MGVTIAGPPGAAPRRAADVGSGAGIGQRRITMSGIAPTSQLTALRHHRLNRSWLQLLLHLHPPAVRHLSTSTTKITTPGPRHMAIALCLGLLRVRRLPRTIIGSSEVQRL